MDLMDYLGQMDSLTQDCTEEQLKRFLQTLAVLMPEESRETSLHTLQKAADMYGENSASGQGTPARHREACARMLEALNRIDGGECAILGECDAELEYDEWGDINWEDYLQSKFEYSDPGDIMRIADIGVNLVHLWAKQEDYASALALGQKLVFLGIRLCEGVLEERTVDIWEAQDKMERQLDLRTLVLDTWLAAYNASENRCGDIFNVANAVVYSEDLGLTDLYNYAKEKLPDFPNFLEELFSYLDGEKFEAAELLFQDALRLLPDDEARAAHVLRHADRHPEGFAFCLLDSPISDEAGWPLCAEALRRVNKNCRLRGELALRGAELACRLERPQDELETFWYEAFASNTSPLNCLRALVHSRDAQETRKKLQVVANIHEEDEKPFTEGQRALNLVSHRDFCAIQFLLGNVLLVLRHDICNRECREIDSFEVEGSCLCLAALYQGAPNSKAMQTVFDMAKKALQFDKNLYLCGVPQKAIQDLLFAQGLPNPGDLDRLPEDTLFRGCFDQWRDRILSYKKSEVEEILSGVQNMVCRNLNDCAWSEENEEFACILAAAGEVRESLGQQGAKQQLLSRIAELYHPQNPSFVSALRRYGWNGK